MFDSLEITAQALSATRTRMNVLASNIANAETTRTEDGGPFKPRRVVQGAHSIPSNFSNALDRMSLFVPKVDAVVTDNRPPKMVHDPSHPDANTEGYVAYPNINVVESMTDMMTVSRLYQANITALQSHREMERQAYQISSRA